MIKPLPPSPKTPRGEMKGLGDKEGTNLILKSGFIISCLCYVTPGGFGFHI